MLSVTDQDINRVQAILLGRDLSFDDERRAVIKCLESRDVLACPGSGKTTALLAKLLIIAPQLPIPENRGICVLAHTNVAIDEIRTGMSESARKLFHYPNYFGTIQGFVDRYLAIPEFVRRFGRRDVRINNDLYEESIERKYVRLSRSARTWLEKKREHMDFLKGIRFRPCDFVLTKGLNGDVILENRSGPAYKGLDSFKLSLLEAGILCYDDAYSLAFQYISIYPALAKLFSLRFGFVFIDEMQDTDLHQIELLKKIFIPEMIVQQRIGDVNQSIYNAAREDIVWDVTPTPLPITGSKRFSQAIAKTIRSVCTEPQTMQGNLDIEDIPPVMIAFSDDNIEKVLPQFGDLIVRNRLHLDPKKIFKAIGWVAKSKDKYHTIPNYWPKYKKEVQVKKEHFGNLWNYLVPQNNRVLSSEGANVYRKSIIRAILKVLSIVGISRGNNISFNERSLLKHLAEIDIEFYDLLNLMLTKWCRRIHAKEDIWSEVKQFIEKDFSTFFGISDLTPAQLFLSDRSPELATEMIFNESNTYIHSPEVKIDLSTIHGVKGETHTATLYLETFYYSYDLVRIIEYLKGNHQKPTQAYVIQNLKMTYVGMSRPSHLLCVAIHKAHIVGHEKALADAGWQLDNDLM